MSKLMQFLDRDFLGANTGDYLAFLATILVLFLLKRPVALLLARFGARIAIRFSDGKYGRLFSSLIRKPIEWLLSVLMLFYAFHFIEVPLSKIILFHWNKQEGADAFKLTDLLGNAFVLLAILSLMLLFSRLLDFFFRTQTERAHLRNEWERAQLLPLLKEVLKIVLWAIGLFWVLGAVFKVNIPALITGLGIGGLAVALAAKESIENLLASFMILTDKPFVVRDTIKLGNLSGKVERIGFRSTRLRSVDGTLLIIPNQKLVGENLENITERNAVKIHLNVSLKNNIPFEIFSQLAEELKQAISNMPQVHQGTNVTINAFAEKSLHIQIDYQLPHNLPEEAIKSIKAGVNAEVFRLVGPYMNVS